MAADREILKVNIIHQGNPLAHRNTKERRKRMTAVELPSLKVPFEGFSNDVLKAAAAHLKLGVIEGNHWGTVLSVRDHIGVTLAERLGEVLDRLLERRWKGES